MCWGYSVAASTSGNRAKSSPHCNPLSGPQPPTSGQVSIRFCLISALRGGPLNVAALCERSSERIICCTHNVHLMAKATIQSPSFSSKRPAATWVQGVRSLTLGLINVAISDYAPLVWVLEYPLWSSMIARQLLRSQNDQHVSILLVSRASFNTWFIRVIPMAPCKAYTRRTRHSTKMRLRNPTDLNLSSCVKLSKFNGWTRGCSYIRMMLAKDRWASP